MQTADELQFCNACAMGDIGRVMLILALESPPINLNWYDGTRGPGLLEACGEGRLAIVELLLRDPRIDPNARNRAGVTPIVAACRMDREDVVEVLLRDPRIEPEHPVSPDETALTTACKGNNVNIVRMLLQHPRIHPAYPNLDDRSWHLLHHACRSGHPGIIELLLQDPRIDPLRVDVHGSTALHVACMQGNVKVVQRLLDLPNCQFDLTQASKNGMTPLHLACQCLKTPAVAELLLEEQYRHRINPSQKSDDQLTALHYACDSGYVDAVAKLLPITNVDLNALTERGYTLLQLACCSTASYPKPLKIVEMLLADPRVDPRAENIVKSTVLEHLCTVYYRQRDVAAVRTLIRNRGYRINYVTTQFACKHASQPFVELLLAVLDGDFEPWLAGSLEIAQHPNRIHITRLLTQFAKNPAKMQRQLCLKYELPTPGSKLFALMILVGDGFLTARPEVTENKEIMRFFRIATSLHLDCQMVLVNRCRKSAANLLPHQDREWAFQDML